MKLFVRCITNVLLSAGFYMENLLNYSTQLQNESIIPLPIGDNHKFAPIALGV